MSRNYKFHNPEGLYFVSFAVVEWLDVFTRNKYKDILLQSLSYCQKEKGMEIIAWCIMTNHVHLQLETKDVEIWHIMRNINLLYTKYFNNKHKLVGHLFQGRYKSELIENDNYNLETSRYIHLNPVRANMKKTPIEYLWSSYDIYMGHRESDLVDENKILSYFKNNSRELYKEYVESKILGLELSDDLEVE